jgi:hypothetical protein
MYILKPGWNPSRDVLAHAHPTGVARGDRLYHGLHAETAGAIKVANGFEPGAVIGPLIDPKPVE